MASFLVFVPDAIMCTNLSLHLTNLLVWAPNIISHTGPLSEAFRHQPPCHRVSWHAKYYYILILLVVQEQKVTGVFIIFHTKLSYVQFLPQINL
jgi:hypothetical protein